MAKKYFYGENGRGYYDDIDVESAIQSALEYNGYKPGEIITIVEMASNRNGERYCLKLANFIEGPEICDGCKDKKFINKSHYCKNLTYGLLETGAIWKYEITLKDFDEEEFPGIDVNRIQKISGRKK